ncbi:unnamed protein product [Closterium sp. NIES-65]|nr:unnamed protein product [Closterium sp. NIES-65]
MTAKELYDVVVARYSSPAIAAIGRFSLPYLFPDLSAFATVADLITHLRTSDLRYRAALPPDFLAKNPPPMYLILYHLVTRLPDSLHVVRDHFLALSPTDLTVDLPEKELLAAETSIVAVGASCGDPRTPFFEGCSPSPLLPSIASAASVDYLGAEGVGLRLLPVGGARAAGARRARVAEVAAGAAVVEGVEGAGVVAVVGVVLVVGGSVAEPGVVAAAMVGVAGVVVAVVAAVELVVGAVERCSVRGSAVAIGSSSSVPARPRRPSSSVSGTISVGGLVEGDCYLRVPPDPGIGTTEAAALGASASAALGRGEAAALGASESAAPGARASASAGIASTEALHTFTLDSGASRCFFRDRTVLEQLARPVAISLTDPSGGPVLATSSTVLPCPAAPSSTLSGLYLPSFSMNLVAGSALQDGGVHQFTPTYERVTHCTCARTGRHLATFTRQPGSDLYTFTTELLV